MHTTLCARLEERLGAINLAAGSVPTHGDIATLLAWARVNAPLAARIDDEFPEPSPETERLADTASVAELEGAIAVLELLRWARLRRFVEDHPERGGRFIPSDFTRPRALAALAFPVPPPAFAVA